MKKSTWIWLLAPVAALGALGFALNTNPPTNKSQTSPEAIDPQLKTRVYNASFEQVLAATRSTIGSLKTYGRAWHTVPQNGLMAFDEREISVAVPVLFFTDYLTVSLKTNGVKTVVNAESHSQVGRGDFGENRRHIIQFLTALDEKLK